MKSTATANPVLTGHARKFMRDPGGFVGVRLFPAFSSGVQSADYYVFDIANELEVPKLLRRAPGTPFKRIMPKISDDKFACSDYGLEQPVPDEDRAKYAGILDADLGAARRLTDIIKINHEIRVKAKIDANAPSANVAVKWNGGNSDPLKDVDAAKEEIRTNIGVLPTTGVISRPVFNVLKVHPKIQDLFKNVVGGVLQEQMLANYFGLRELLIADQVIATNQEGQAITAADIWGDDLFLAHVNPSQDLMALNFGRTFYWTRQANIGADGVPIAIETYRDEAVKSDIHRALHDTDEKVVGSKAGYLLKDVL